MKGVGGILTASIGCAMAWAVAARDPTASFASLDIHVNFLSRVGQGHWIVQAQATKWGRRHHATLVARRAACRRRFGMHATGLRKRRLARQAASITIPGSMLLPLPPLNALKAFEVTGRLRSISRAAEELHVTPAAVSRQIKALEDFLGVQLFDRSGGRFALTSVGERYLESVAASLTGLRTATNAAMGGTYRRHVLRLRSPATFAVKWLIPRLAGFHSSHPTIDVQLTTSSAPLDFEREDIDAGVELGDGAWPRVNTILLVPNELVPVMARDAAFPPPAGPEELQRCTLLHSLARPDDWSLWLRAAGTVNVNPYSGMKYETSLLAYQAASEGHGIAVAQKVFVEKELANGDLFAPIDFVLDRGRHTYYFVWPMGREPSAPLSAFIAWLRQIARGSP